MGGCIRTDFENIYREKNEYFFEARMSNESPVVKEKDVEKKSGNRRKKTKRGTRKAYSEETENLKKASYKMPTRYESTVLSPLASRSDTQLSNICCLSSKNFKARKCKEENVFLSYCDEEDSRNENAASWEIAGAENALCVCVGSSAAVWKTSDGWSKDGCSSGSSESESTPTSSFFGSDSWE